MYIFFSHFISHIRYYLILLVNIIFINSLQFKSNKIEYFVQLDDDSFKRMCKFALETPCFSKQSTLENNSELQSVLPGLRHEINIDFTRTLNRLIFDKIVAKNQATYPYIKLPKEQADKLQTVQVKGECFFSHLILMSCLYLGSTKVISKPRYEE